MVLWSRPAYLASPCRCSGILVPRICFLRIFSLATSSFQGSFLWLTRLIPGILLHGVKPICFQAPCCYSFEHLSTCVKVQWLSFLPGGKHQESRYLSVCFTVMPLLPSMVLQTDAQQSWKEKELVSSLPPTVHQLCDLWCFTTRSLSCSSVAWELWWWWQFVRGAALYRSHLLH